MQCPLCRELKRSSIEIIPYAQIWSSLTTDLGATFTQDVIERHTPALDVSLFECLNCGLQYFNPAVSGDAEFYSQLTSSVAAYYSAEKWDFQAAIQLIAPGDSVLDIACGGGSFLQLARAKGAEICGIDTNPAAVEEARKHDLPVHGLDLPEFAAKYPGRFDVVTAFQVIEHIPEVPPFVRSASACLKPGGKLLLTVPNRLRRFRAPFEPLDHPPHHLSRWTARQFQELAQLIGLKLVAIRYEPGRMPDCRALLRQWIAPVGQTESWWARAIARLAFGPSLYKIYAALGLLDRRLLRGMSVMAVLEK